MIRSMRDGPIELPGAETRLRHLERDFGCRITVRDQSGLLGLPVERQRHRHIAVCAQAFCRRRCIAHCRHETHRRCLAADGPFVQTCWKGISEIVVPLVQNEQLHGCLFAGSWRGARPARELPADLQARIAALPRLRRSTARDLAGALQLLAAGLPVTVGPADSRDAQRRRCVRTLLRQRHRESLGLDDAAAALGCSPSRAGQIVRQGVTTG